MTHPQTSSTSNVPLQTQYSYPARTYAYPPVTPTVIMASGLFGMVVGTSSTLGVNLHHVQDDRMTMTQAVADSLAKGAGAGVATAVAVGVARSIGGGSLGTFAVTLATATGVAYVLNSIGRKQAKPISSADEKTKTAKGGKK